MGFAGLGTFAELHAPAWQYGPSVVDASLINADLYTHPVFQRAMQNVINFKGAEFSEIEDLSAVLGFTANKNITTKDEPRSLIVGPVFQDFEEDSPGVGFLIAVESWTPFFADTLPEGINGFRVFTEGSCGSENSYAVDGPQATFTGKGDLHRNIYDGLIVQRDIAAFAVHSANADECSYTVSVYPSKAFEEQYYTSKPFVYSAVVLAMFLVTCSVFFMYDRFVQVRQVKLVTTAARTKKIVTSLFPENVGKKLLEQAELAEDAKNDRKKSGFAPKGGLKDFLDGDDVRRQVDGSEPIADFFSDTTIMFCDVSFCFHVVEFQCSEQSLNDLFSLSLNTTDCWFHCLVEYKRTQTSFCPSGGRL